MGSGPSRSASERSRTEYLKRQQGVKATIEELAFSLDKPLASLFRFRITIAPRALRRVELWAFTALHTGLFVLKQNGYDIFQPVTNSRAPIEEWGLTVEFAAVAIPSGFMSLLLVFFNSQCYGRYMTLYGSTCGMMGTLQEIAEITSVMMAGYPAQRWDVSRYALASAICVYSKVIDLSQNETPKLDDEDWERLLNSEEAWLGTAKEGVEPTMPALLDEKEHLVLRSPECTGKEFQILQMWALDAAFRVYAANGADGLSGAHGYHYGRLEDAVLRLRAHGAAITNTLDMPIPFPYYHALVAIMFINFGLYTLAFLDINSYLTPLAIFMIIFVTTAMRELSSALANPFGDDEVDFNVSAYVHKKRKLISFLALSERWRLDAYDWAPAEVEVQLPSHQPHHPADLEAAYAAVAQQQQQPPPPPQQQQAQQRMAYERPYHDAGGGGGGYGASPGETQLEQRLALEQQLAEQGAQIAALQASLRQTAACRARTAASARAAAAAAAGAVPTAPREVAPPEADGTARPAPPILPPVISGPRRGLQLEDHRGPVSTMPPLTGSLPPTATRRAPPPLPSSAAVVAQPPPQQSLAPRSVPPTPMPSAVPAARAPPARPAAAATPPGGVPMRLQNYHCVNVNGRASWQPVAAGAQRGTGGAAAFGQDDEIVYEKED